MCGTQYEIVYHTLYISVQCGLDACYHLPPAAARPGGLRRGGLVLGDLLLLLLLGLLGLRDTLTPGSGRLLQAK